VPEKSVAKNSAFFFAAQGAASLLAFATSILIARRVGPYVAGQYAYLVWLASVLTAVCTLGIPNAITKFTAELSEGDRQEIAERIGGMLLLGTTVVGVGAALILCLVALLHLLPANTHASYYYLIALALPINIIGASLVGLFKGNHRYSLLMWANIIASPVTFVIVLLVLHFSPALGGLVTYYILSSAILLLSYLIMAPARIRMSLGRVPAGVWRPILRYVASVSGIILLDQIVWDRSEVFFLGHYSAPQQVAYYTLSYTMVSTVMALFPGSIVGALLPRISALQGIRDTEAISGTYRMAARYVGLIVALLVGGGFALASPFVVAFYGPAYVHMVPVFRLLIVTGGLAAIGGVSAVIFYGTTGQSVILKTGLLLSLVNIGGDFLIIPHYGAIGAGEANGLAQISGVLSGIYFLTKRGIKFPVGDYLRIGLVTAVSTLITWGFTRWLGVGAVVSLIVGITVFLTLFTACTLGAKLIRLREIPVLNKHLAERT
jgi:stage V sporulation protein B